MIESTISLSLTLSGKLPDFFDKLWEMPAEWVEPPNRRRGGWSGATRVTLRGDEGAEMRCILKKQQNHSYYSIRNGLLPRPTLEREAENLRFLNSVGIHVPEVLFYGKRKHHKKHQALLLIPELTDYQSLTEILRQPEPMEGARREIAIAIGAIASKLHHQVKWYHRNLYPKHLFLKINDDAVKVCLIDLENAKPLRRDKHVIDDLGPLFRRAKSATLIDHVAFMKSYCQCDKLGSAERSLMKRIALSK